MPEKEELRVKEAWERLRDLMDDGLVMDSAGRMSFTTTVAQPPAPLDLSVLRIRYEDDPLAMALLSELERQRESLIAITGTVARLQSQQTELRRQANDRASLLYTLERENKLLKETLDSERERYRDIIEKLALATGKFKLPEKP